MSVTRPWTVMVLAPAPTARGARAESPERCTASSCPPQRHDSLRTQRRARFAAAATRRLLRQLAPLTAAAARPPPRHAASPPPPPPPRALESQPNALALASASSPDSAPGSAPGCAPDSAPGCAPDSAPGGAPTAPLTAPPPAPSRRRRPDPRPEIGRCRRRRLLLAASLAASLAAALATALAARGPSPALRDLGPSPRRAPRPALRLRYHRRREGEGRRLRQTVDAIHVRVVVGERLHDAHHPARATPCVGASR